MLKERKANASDHRAIIHAELRWGKDRLQFFGCGFLGKPCSKAPIGSHPTTHHNTRNPCALTRPQRLGHQDLHHRLLKTGSNIRHILTAQGTRGSEFARPGNRYRRAGGIRRFCF